MVKILLFLLLIPNLAVAQINEGLRDLLPDSIKPVTRERMSYTEIAILLDYVLLPNGLQENNRREIDMLCGQFGEKLTQVGTKQQKLRHATVVTRYWFYRYTTLAALGQTLPPLLDSTEKYTQIVRSIISTDSIHHPIYVAFGHLMNGRILVEKQQFSPAFDRYQQALIIYKENNYFDGLRQVFSSISNLYNHLKLYQLSIAYSDSSHSVERKLQNDFDYNPKFSHVRSALLIHKALGYEGIWRNDRKKESLDSATMYCNELISNRLYRKDYRHLAFKLASGISYANKEFKLSMNLADSAQALIVDKSKSVDYAGTEMLKGLCLIRLGKRKEGATLIRNNEKLGASSYHEADILEDLYNYEKGIGNLKNALKYHELLMALQKTSQLSKSQGEIFEMQQKFDVAERDLSIQKLLTKEKDNKLYATILFLAIGIMAIFWGFRYNQIHKRTQHLVNQMNELTELQLSRIEDEKERERKRIGQELHDELSGTIATGVSYLRMKAGEELESGLKQYLIEISDMLEIGYNKARGKSHELYLEETSKNFWKRLSDNIELFFSGTDMKVSLTYDTFDLILTPEVKTTILLVIKEAITNVIKHAKATEVDILIYEEANSLILEVSDNGIGISGTRIEKNVGLRSIQERAEKLNGKMYFGPRKHSGVTLKIMFPIEPFMRVRCLTH